MYIARRKFAYRGRTYEPGDRLEASRDDALLMQRQRKIGLPQAAVRKPPETAMKPPAEPLSELTVAKLRERLKKQGKPTGGKKAELIERLRG